MSTLPPPPFVRVLAERFSELAETHISWVFLGSDEVLKLKKPVKFAFLDFSTLELRRSACEAELSLNRRLSPDVYLGVEPITLDADGAPVVGGEGTPIEYAVRMRRLPDAQRADVMFSAGKLEPEQLELLAEHVARFHASAAIDRDERGPGSLEVLSCHVEENLSALAEAGARVLGAARFEALCARQRADLVEHAALFRKRLAAGLVRDGHGDLRLDHVYFAPDGIRILDCVEFDRAFRVADVCADVAFFAMNLYERGQAAWAERFVARYARDSADHELYALLDFYLTYWALVRAKVSEARAEQMEGEAQSAQRKVAGDLLELAHRFACEPRGKARLVAVGGVIGSGKSRLAERVGLELSAPVLQSDRLRKQLQGVAPEERLTNKEAYSAVASERLYDELLSRARAVLRSGRPVIVDASFRAAELRARFAALAAELDLPFAFFECHAPRNVLEARLRGRESKKTISDARIDLLDTFLARYEPLTEQEAEAYAHRVDTSGRKEDTWFAVASCLQAR